MNTICSCDHPIWWSLSVRKGESQCKRCTQWTGGVSDCCRREWKKKGDNQTTSCDHVGRFVLVFGTCYVGHLFLSIHHLSSPL